MLINTANLFLLVFALLGYLSKNSAVTYAMLFLLIARITPLSMALPHIEKYGLRLGILILTIGVMSPIATGKVDSSALLGILTNWHAWIAIVIGVFVSWVGGQGIQLLHTQPHSIAGLLIGTMIGISVFNGVPVGPIIAAGLLSLLYKTIS